MPFWLWIALGVSFGAMLAGVAIAAARFVALIRDFRRLGRELRAVLVLLGDAAETAAGRVEAVTGSSARLQAELDRLSASLARWSLVLAAAREVRDAAAGLSAFVPRK